MSLNLKPLADRLVVEPIEREEVTARIGGLSANSRYQNLRFGHIDDDCTVCLARDCARINSYCMFPKLETLSCRFHDDFSD